MGVKPSLSARVIKEKIMRGIVRRWIVAGGVGVAALAAGAGGTAASVAGAAGAPTTATVVHAAGDCQPLQCGGNHNQVLA
jgi:hypothetical protein